MSTSSANVFAFWSLLSGIYEPAPARRGPAQARAVEQTTKLEMGPDMPEFFQVHGEPGFKSVFREKADSRVFEISPAAIETTEKLGKHSSHCHRYIVSTCLALI